MTPERRAEIRREVAGWPPLTELQKATIAAAMRPEMAPPKAARKRRTAPQRAA